MQLFVGMALVLSLSNLYGYFRCRFGSNANAGSVITQYVGPKMLFNVSVDGGDDIIWLTMSPFLPHS